MPLSSRFSSARAPLSQPVALCRASSCSTPRQQALHDERPVRRVLASNKAQVGQQAYHRALEKLLQLQDS